MIETDAIKGGQPDPSARLIAAQRASNQEEALELADRVVVMMEGRVAQTGTPDEVYDRPATPQVYQFLGDVNLFRGRVADGGFLHNPHQPESDTDVTAFVRPHDLEVDRFASSDSSIPAKLLHAYALGPKVRLEMRRSDSLELLEAEISRDRHRNLGLAAGDKVWVTPKSLRLFRDGEEVAI